jgi:hypothetical protein
MGGHCSEILSGKLHDANASRRVWKRRHIYRARGVFVKKRATWIAAAMIVCTLSACSREEKRSVEGTATIAPAAGQPAPTGTDAMTQTVDVEDGRSEAEGAGLTETTATTTTTTPAKVPAKKPVPAKKHK